MQVYPGWAARIRSDFIPKSVVNGFINGIALIIILAQAGRFSGIELRNEASFPRILGSGRQGPRSPSAYSICGGGLPSGDARNAAPCCAGSRRP